MSPEGDGDVASPVPSEDRNGSSSTVTPLSLQPQAHLREERPSRGSRTGSSDTTLSRGVENDCSAHFRQGDFELEQDAGHFHFDKDTDAEGDKSKAEDKGQPLEAVEDLEKANGIFPMNQQPTRNSTGSQRRKDPNMVSKSQANGSWFVRLRLAILRPKSRDVAKPQLPTEVEVWQKTRICC